MKYIVFDGSKIVYFLYIPWVNFMTIGKVSKTIVQAYMSAKKAKLLNCMHKNLYPRAKVYHRVLKVQLIIAPRH
jgi:hypothetical protein